MKTAVSAAGLCLAVLIPSAARSVTVETVAVGNAGNGGDPQDRGAFGAVAYEYEIGKLEITNAQYVEFLNAVAQADTRALYNPDMAANSWGGITRRGVFGSYEYSVKADAVGAGPGGTDYTYGDKPVVYVSWHDALRFANWMHNGQPTGAQDAGSTEDGAYTFSGLSTVGPRNSGAVWALASEDEWFKAAYHANDGATDNFYIYPTGTDAIPNNNLPTADTGNSANFRFATYTTGSFAYPMTDVGAYALSASPYGALDMAGNAREWTEGIVGSSRVLWGGSWIQEFPDLAVSGESLIVPNAQNNNIGFRLVKLPEPGSLLLAALAAVGLAAGRWGRRSAA